MAVLVLGAFDIPHGGHLRFIIAAQRYGYVVVGLSTDDLLARTKRVPYLSYSERADALRALGCDVVPRRHESAFDVFESVQPDLFICGNDWLDNNHLAATGVDRDYLNAHNISVVYLPRPHSLSTTEIVRRVKEAS